MKLTLGIRTDYWPKPIPLRCFDWTAVSEDWDKGMPVGHGATEQEAIAHLLEQEEEAMDDEQYAQWCEDESRRDDARCGFEE